MINDACHDYGVMLHYIKLDKQRLQLEQMGFCPTVESFVLDGNTACNESHECGHSAAARQWSFGASTTSNGTGPEVKLLDPRR